MGSEAVTCQEIPEMNQGDMLFWNQVPDSLGSNSGPHRLSSSVYPSELTGTLGNLCISASLPATHMVLNFGIHFLHRLMEPWQ